MAAVLGQLACIAHLRYDISLGVRGYAFLLTVVVMMSSAVAESG